MRNYYSAMKCGRSKVCLLFLALLFLSTTVLLLHSQCCKESARKNGVESGEVHDNSRQHMPQEHSSKTTSHSSQRPAQRVAAEESCGQPSAGGGFALALSFHDQQTWAFGNLFSLQNWAAGLNLTVLEPFLVSTTLRLPPTKVLQSSSLPLSVLYDMEHWNKNGELNGIAPTVPWDCFLLRAPRQLLLVHIDPIVRNCDAEKRRSKAKLLTEFFGFSIVRELCLPAVHTSAQRLSVAKFNERILGNLSAGEVTVVFSEWSQHTVGTLLDMDYAHIPMALSSTLPLRPSAEVKRDADTYISRYLDGGHFVSVLFRSEWLTMYSSASVFNRTLQECVTKTLDYIDRAREKTGAKSVFLGLDVGRYGSATVETEKEEIAWKAFDKRLLPSTQFQSFSEWEQSFESVSSYQVPGYVALLQRTVAVQGSCLLLMGSGSFLKQALDQYKMSHSHNSQKRCYLETEGKCNAFRRAGI